MCVPRLTPTAKFWDKVGLSCRERVFDFHMRSEWGGGEQLWTGLGCPAARASPALPASCHLGASLCPSLHCPPQPDTHTLSLSGVILFKEEIWFFYFQLFSSHVSMSWPVLVFWVSQNLMLGWFKTQTQDKVSESPSSAPDYDRAPLFLLPWDKTHCKTAPANKTWLFSISFKSKKKSNITIGLGSWPENP